MRLSSPLLLVLPATVALGAVPVPASAQVSELWTDQFTGPSTLNDTGQAVATDASGGAVVAGWTYEEVTPGYFVPRFLTMRFGPDGTRDWVNLYQGDFATGGAAARHVAFDHEGNIIVSGAANFSDDWAIVKYGPDGELIWIAVYPTESTYLTEPSAMAVDAAGNVYLTGDVGTFDASYAVTVKYTAAGALAWEDWYAGPVFDGALGNALAVADDGSVYVAGAAVVPGLASEFAVWKLDVDGQFRWLQTHGAFGSFTHDRAYDIAIAADGSIVAAGLVSSNSTIPPNGSIRGYAPDGTVLWEDTYDGPVGQTDAYSTLAIGPAGRVHVGGYSQVGSGDYDALLVTYRDGVREWEERVSGDEVHYDYASDVAVHDDGSVYMCGAMDPIGGSRYFTAKYEATGTPQWMTDFAGPMGGGAAASAIALGPGGRVVVTGDAPAPGAGFDAFTIMYQEPTTTPGDVTGDGSVDIADLLAVLSAWGDCAGCPEDLDGDGVVGITDLLEVLGSWG